jgi:hypothetical protein
VFWQGRVHRVYFPRPLKSQSLEPAAKTRLLAEVDMASDDDQGKDFIRRSTELYDEMVWYDSLRRHRIPGTRVSVYELVGQKLDDLRKLALGVACVINFILLVSLEVGGQAGEG